MAQITQQQILALSEPVEQIYSNVVDALLVNLAKHLKGGGTLTTEQWEMQKLSEMGQLTQESIEIIANLTGLAPEEIEKAMENAVLWATEDVEKALKEGVKKGAVSAPPSQGVLASESVAQALRALEAQAVDKTNLVNTNMLQSTLAQYRKAVANTAHIERQIRAVQQTMDTQASRVATGTATRTQALREALGQIHKEGITGFYDKAGRQWTPEAYVNMTVRTTVHNTAIESVKIRQEDYGADIFQVSRHSGARPLCYPYQGRFFTWNNSGGTFMDGEGKNHRYAPISSTSYGKPAGLFGINCGHHPIPIIPGVTIPRERAKQNKEQNDKAYALSQKQRALERNIRYAKQRAAMLEAAGRTKRTDRTQVFGYNKNVASSAKQVQRFNSVINGTKTVDGVAVSVSAHTYAQAKARNVSAENIVDALTAPLSVRNVKFDAKNRPSKQYIGAKATASVNPLNGRVTSCWRTSSEKAKKLAGGKGDEV